MTRTNTWHAKYGVCLGLKNQSGTDTDVQCPSTEGFYNYYTAIRQPWPPPSPLHPPIPPPVHIYEQKLGTHRCFMGPKWAVCLCPAIKIVPKALCLGKNQHLNHTHTRLHTHTHTHTYTHTHTNAYGQNKMFETATELSKGDLINKFFLPPDKIRCRSQANA